jgi:hypothetical protein
MRTEMKNKHMQEANRLAEMEYMKSREEMGVPSPANEGDQFNPSAGDDKISKEPGFSSNQDDSYEEGLYDNEGNPLKPGGEEDFETMFYRSLNGSEIQSMDFEGTVYVDGRNKCIVRDGEKMRPSEDELKTLWKEYVDGEGLYEVAGLEQFKPGMKLKSNGKTYTIQMVQPSMVKGMEAAMALRLKDDKTGKEFDDSPGKYEIVTNEAAMEEELNEIKRITKQLLGE